MSLLFSIYKMTALIIILAVIALGLMYCYSETLHFKTTKYNIACDKLAGKNMVLLSDMHCISYGKDNKRLIKAIKACNPDMIVIAGDLINGKSKKEFTYAFTLLDALKRLKIPVYYAFGNHELKLIKYAGDAAYTEYFNEVKKRCIVLNNSSLKNNDVSIHGILLENDKYYGKLSIECEKLDIKKYLGKPHSESFNILIAHDPSFCSQYGAWGADLVLSGHYHGGIVRVPFIGGLVSPRWQFFPVPDKGIYDYSNCKLIVSGGLGWHGIPFRFLNLPEIVNITFN